MYPQLFSKAICDIDEASVVIVFSIDAKGNIQRSLEGQSISKQHTRRSQQLHDDLPEENIRYMIQQCLGKQPGKRFQLIKLQYRDGDEIIQDGVIIHHYYTVSNGSFDVGKNLNTEVIRVGSMWPPNLQTLKVQDMMAEADTFLKKIFDALRYSFLPYKSPVKEKDLKKITSFLESKASLVRPTGDKTFREMFDINVEELNLFMLQSSFATVVGMTLLNIAESYQSFHEVEARYIQLLREKPQIYILICVDIIDDLEQQLKEAIDKTSSSTDTDELMNPFEDVIYPTKMVVRHPLTNRCMQVNGPSYMKAVATYGLDVVESYGSC